MTGFRTAHAVVDDWRTAAERVGAGLSGNAGAERPEMGFVYVSDRFAGSYADIVASLRQGTGVRDWTGSVGLGVLADDEELNDRPAIAAAVLSLPAGSWRLVADSAVLPTADGAGPGDDALFPVAVVHADAGHADTSAQIARLAERSGAFLVGGLASSRQALPPAPPPFTGSAVSGVLLREDVALRTGLSQGCTPSGRFTG